MSNRSYYKLFDNFGNYKIDNRYLSVNCTGFFDLKSPFNTNESVGRHDYYYQYVTLGNMKTTIDDKQTTFESGQFIIYAAETPYNYVKLSDEDLNYYWIHFSGYGISEILNDLNLFCNKIYTIGTSEGIQKEFSKLFREFTLRESGFESATAAIAMNVLCKSARLANEMDKAKLNSSVIYKSLDFIYKNLSENLSVSNLAKYECLSTSYYRTIFKVCTGFSPIGYIISLRIKRACELLTQTDMSVKEISHTCGYEDQIYFSRIFKKKTKMTPCEYKASFKN